MDNGHAISAPTSRHTQLPPNPSGFFYPSAFAARCNVRLLIPSLAASRSISICGLAPLASMSVKNPAVCSFFDATPAASEVPLIGAGRLTRVRPLSVMPEPSPSCRFLSCSSASKSVMRSRIVCHLARHGAAEQPDLDIGYVQTDRSADPQFQPGQRLHDVTAPPLKPPRRHVHEDRWNKVLPSMLASSPASRLNQKLPDSGIPRLGLKSSRSRRA
jgi:hypothetical protein